MELLRTKCQWSTLHWQIKPENNPLSGHNQALRDWQDTYGDELSIALTDTFTTDFFFADFTPEQMTSWKGLRHDSGDPIEIWK